MLTPAAARAQSSCSPSSSATAKPENGRTASLSEGVDGNVELTAKTEQFVLGDGRGPAHRTIVLEAKPRLPPGATLIAEPVEDFEAEGGGTSFPLEGVVVTPAVTSFGAVQLKICIDPQHPEAVGRGRYVGAIQVGGPGIETATVPVELTLRTPIWLAIGLALGGLLFGLALKMAADLNKDPNAQIDRTWMAKYVKRGAFVTAVLLGFAGVGLNLWQLYDANPIWGSSADFFKIFAAGVALQVTGSTAIDFFSPFKAPVQ